MKRTKKFDQEWAQAIALLPTNIQQPLTQAIRCYQNEGVEPKDLHPVAQALFIVIKPTIDVRARRCAYQKQRRQRINRSCLQQSAAPELQKTSEPQPLKLKSQEAPVIETSTPAIITDKRPSPANRFLRDVNKAKNKSRQKRYAGTR